MHIFCVILTTSRIKCITLLLDAFNVMIRQSSFCCNQQLTKLLFSYFQLTQLFAQQIVWNISILTFSFNFVLPIFLLQLTLVNSESSSTKCFVSANGFEYHIYHTFRKAFILKLPPAEIVRIVSHGIYIYC